MAKVLVTKLVKLWYIQTVQDNETTDVEASNKNVYKHNKKNSEAIKEKIDKFDFIKNKNKNLVH